MFDANQDISVIIIAMNEAHAIRECLESVKWASEIIVVDSGSTDNTVSICESFGAKVYHQPNWQGFGYQKNYALGLATKPWVLSIDADERVSDALRGEIASVLQRASNQAFRMPRSSSYCGQFIRHSGWSPDYILRLFPRTAARFNDQRVHESVVFHGSIETLKHPMLHISYVDLEEVLQKMNRYSSDGAQMLFECGKSSSLTKAILHGAWAFIRTYLLRLGFLDGKMGFILAVSNAETTYYRYLKLMLKQRSN